MPQIKISIPDYQDRFLKDEMVKVSKLVQIAIDDEIYRRKLEQIYHANTLSKKNKK